MIAIYLLKSSLCLGVLYGFYKLALEHNAMHQFKRFYLLASLIFALTIPLITITYTSSVTPELVPTFVPAAEVTQNASPLLTPIEPSTSILPYILWSLYGLGVFIFGSRFALNLFRLKRKIETSETLPKYGFTLALLPQTIVPHSFFRWIFLSRKRYENNEIAPEVLAHEATHVRQKHSLDILFIELLQVFFWFNPLIWLSKKSIKLNHEFLADRGALENDSDVYHYQHILLSYASSTDHAALESPFNYSLTKKRILMLSKTISRKRAIVSALLLLPVLTGCVLAFNNAIVAVPENAMTHPIEGAWIDHANENKNVSIYQKNDTLWWDQVVMKVPIQVENNTYSITSAREVWKLSLTENDQLKMGSAFFTRPDDKFSYRIDGSWQKVEGETVYTFITKNGQPTCDIAPAIGSVATRYYPKRTENGMTINVDGKPISFTIKNNSLIMQDGNVLRRIRNTSVYDTLENQESSYAQNFIAGAARNEKKAIVIEIQNDQISLNGTVTTVATLRRDIDAWTKNWSDKDFTSAVPSFLYKNNSANFLQDANIQFKKTKFSKVNKGLQLNHPTSSANSKQVGASSEELIKYNDLAKKYNAQAKADRKIPASDLKTLETVYRKMSTSQKANNEAFPECDIQNPVSSKELKVYNRLATKYANYSKGKILQGEVARMYDIYSRMTAAQKKTAKAYPALPPPPPPPPAPAAPKVKKGEKSDIPPPPPPAPPKAPKPPKAKDLKNLPPPPPPPSAEEHFVKMRKLGGKFYYEKKEISFEEAVKLVNENDNLSIKTPYPYSKPPKTFITKSK